MKRIFILSLFLFCLFTSSKVYACSCATGEPAMEFNYAKAVFIGQMIGGTEKLSYKDQKGITYQIEAGNVLFTVKKNYKGKLKQQITIDIPSMDGTSCGPYGLIRGERYLVYAYTSEKNKNTLYSGVCTRTISVNTKYAKEDLKFLKNLPPAGTGGNLKGDVFADLKARGTTPLAGVKVRIQSPDKKIITVITDSKGQYEVKKLKAGQYRVEPELPPNYITEQEFALVRIDDRGTAGADFEAYLNGQVSGRVIDQDGRAYNSAFLNLIDGDKSVDGYSTKEDGNFEIKGVPPGNYKLFIKMQSKDFKYSQNYYYPGTFDEEKAAIFEVELGGKIENLSFRLPKRFKVRTIEGHVVWEDGQPAVEAKVDLFCRKISDPNGYFVDLSPISTITDKQGRFKLEGFAGETYSISAVGSKQTSKDAESVNMYSLSKKVILMENLTDLKIVFV